MSILELVAFLIATHLAIGCIMQVGSRLIQLFMETAYIQPPVDHLDDTPPDIRPAFVHTLKQVRKDS